MKISELTAEHHPLRQKRKTGLEKVEIYISELTDEIVELEDQNTKLKAKLIAVDDVLKGGRIIQVTSTPLNKFAQGNNVALTEIRKAIESIEKE